MAYSDTVDLRRGTIMLVASVAVWGLTVAILAQAGVYRAVNPLLLAPVIVLGIVLPFAIYAASSGFKRYMAAVGLRRITAFHIWRIPAALFIFWYGANHLPAVFVRDAGWGDLLAGCLALVVTLLPPTRGRYLAVHLFGFADFVVALGTGMVLTLLHDPLMSSIQTLPMALFPLFGVGVSGASHLIAFDMLWRRVGFPRQQADAASCVPLSAGSASAG